jgi:hypothetical protein
MPAERIFDLARDDLAALRGRALDDAVRAAEGRTMVAEVFAAATLLDGVHNAELMAAHGADIVVLNLVEAVWSGRGAWSFPVLTRATDLAAFAAAVGRPVAVNLEPDPDENRVPAPRRATPDNAQALLAAGAAGLVLTANPGTGASYADLVAVTATLRTALGPDASLWVGKMHHAGHPEPVTAEALVPLVDAGASAVLVPVPGTVPGVTRDDAATGVRAVHERGALAVGAVGTSQEGAPPHVATALALGAKEIGFDAHHVGDCGFFGTGDPDFLRAWSLAVRGRRHTWRRMALGARSSPPR